MKILSASFPTLAFHASITNSFGKGALISLLRQFSKLHSVRLQPDLTYFDSLSHDMIVTGQEADISRSDRLSQHRQVECDQCISGEEVLQGGPDSRCKSR